ncbi:hypothetical protein ACFS2C_09430 [Prauserella oleivorans]|uniref:Bifunctional DNA primase/polymerase-like protein n=1 Tax=Prauserella oleivorans TaxID=1478153 RepID=A0ABW5W6M1_9PSEU
MSAARITVAPLRLDAASSRLQAAAMEYVTHGWGVLPGSACDGLRYTQGHTAAPTYGLVPVWGSGRTTREARRAWGQWNVAPYAILARAGEDFDVLTAPTWLAVEAVGRSQFTASPCPVSIAPDGVRLFVRRGARLWPELADVRGVGLVEPGAVVPLPPTRMVGGSATWWLPPEAVGWHPGDPDAAQAALVAVLGEAPDGGWHRP